MHNLSNGSEEVSQLTMARNLRWDVLYPNKQKKKIVDQIYIKDT